MVDHTTPFDPEDIASRLPGFDIVSLAPVTDGKAGRVIQADYHGTPWLRFFPDRRSAHIGAIVALHPGIKTAPFAAIGTPYRDVYRKNSQDLCHNSDINAAVMECRSLEADTVFYRFGRHSMVVEAIIWRSDAPTNTHYKP